MHQHESAAEALRAGGGATPAEELLGAIVALVSSWSSTEVQSRIAHRIGLDIGESDVRTLHTIGRFGGGARPAQLADELQVTRPTMSKSLARLAAAGFITRTQAAHDGRATDVALTLAGARAYEALVDAGVEMVRRALDAAPTSDVASIIAFTRALRASG
ncbi:MarR family transcriptional regulator [Leucobacter sp. gxy201]|uniref:MarR family winged helix-turn-helix transcriptional regulator n=1 Tax=Leucobacter sp. gxy201 TaxID=2957200 RepID=UPI003DA0FD75